MTTTLTIQGTLPRPRRQPSAGFTFLYRVAKLCAAVTIRFSPRRVPWFPFPSPSASAFSKPPKRGETTSEVAERFAVSPAFVRRLLQRYRATGSLQPKTGRRGPKPRLDEHQERIRELITQQPDLHPAEIRDRLGLAVAAITVWRALVRLGLTFKKSRSARPSRIGPTLRPPDSTGRSRWPRLTPDA